MSCEQYIDIVLQAPPVYIDFVSEGPPVYIDVIMPLISELLFTVLTDSDDPYYYTGVAFAGSAENAAVWKITRREISPAGTIVSTATLTNVKWSERLTLEY